MNSLRSLQGAKNRVNKPSLGLSNKKIINTITWSNTLNYLVKLQAVLNENLKTINLVHICQLIYCFPYVGMYVYVNYSSTHSIFCQERCSSLVSTS